MNFGEALIALREGKKVARQGWNGKGMFLYLTDASTVEFEQLRGNCAKHISKENTGMEVAYINPHIDMKSADGSIVVGWLASQTDMLSNDWEIVQ